MAKRALKATFIEPAWPGNEMSAGAAYNYYNYSCKDKAAKIKLLVKHWDQIEDIAECQLKDITKVDKNAVPGVLGYLARMSFKGYKFDKDQIEYIKSNTKRITTLKKVEVVVDKSKPKAPVISIQERMKNKLSDILGDVDNALDQVADDKDPKFNMYKWMTEHELKSNYGKMIREFYEPRLAELKEVLDKTDEQLVEGYKNLKNSTIKAMIKFCEDVLHDAETYAKNFKKVASPRRKKVVPLTRVVAKLKYLVDYPELKISSILPEHICGAYKLWVYNTKNRLLTEYKAIDAAGLSVKGTTILNYVGTSKKLRKPEETIKRLMTAGKSTLKKVMDEITTKGAVAKGQTNSNTVLLKVEK